MSKFRKDKTNEKLAAIISRGVKYRATKRYREGRQSNPYENPTTAMQEGMAHIYDEQIKNLNKAMAHICDAELDKITRGNVCFWCGQKIGDVE